MSAKLTATMHESLRILALHGVLDSAHNTAAGLHRRGFLRSPSRFLYFQSLTEKGLQYLVDNFDPELRRCARMKGGLSGVRASRARFILRFGIANYLETAAGAFKAQYVALHWRRAAERLAAATH